MIEGHLLFDGPRDGATNMAIDQVLLETVSTGAPPVFRFYQWSAPTLSLGYFQSINDRNQHPPSECIDVVRRSTGGGAIVHDRELTYSLSLPWSLRSDSSNLAIYRQVHEAIQGSLAAFGVHAIPYRLSQVGSLSPRSPSPFLCFQRRTDEDLVVHGYKVLGSAQRRVDSGLLQHGSLLLTSSPSAPELPGIEALTGIHLPVAELAEMIARKTEPLLGIRWTTQTGSLIDMGHVTKVVAERFRCGKWTCRR